MRAVGLFKWTAIVLLMASVAFAGAQAFWHAMGETAIRAPAIPPPPPARAAPEIDLAPVLAFAPFGATAPVAVAAPDAPAVQLDLKLFGVMVDGVQQNSRALIGHDGETRSYRVGETIAEAATLTEVRDTSVLLTIGGATRVLGFDRFEPAEAAPEADDPLDRLSSALVLTPRDPLVPDEDPAQPGTTEEYIAFWRDQIRRNPAQVLQSVGFEPVGNGYRVAKEHDSGIALAGLTAGDVVTSVNGSSIGNVVEDRRLFDEVIASGVARVEVERGGRTISMTFPIR